MDEKTLKDEELESVGGGLTGPDCAGSPGGNRDPSAFGGARKPAADAVREI